jgi:Ethanolamine utilization protein EutJ (predicted chaperonin)
MSQYMFEATATSWTKTSIPPGRSRAARWSVSLLAAIGLTASVLASLTTWLVVTDPVTVSNAISTRDAEALTRGIGTALIAIVRVLIGYL